MTDQLGGRANQHGADVSDLNGVVSHQTVTALDELHRSLTLTNTGLTHDENTLTGDIHENAMAGGLGGQGRLQMVGDQGDKDRGGFLTAQNGPLVLYCHLHEFRIGLQSTGQDHRRNGLLEEGVEALPALLRGLRAQVGPLHLTQDLDAVGVEIVKKTQDLQGGTVDVILPDEAPLVVLAGIENFQFKTLNDLNELHGCLRYCHGDSSFFSLDLSDVKEYLGY